MRLVAAGRVFANKGDRAAGVLGRESKLVHQLAKVRFMSKPADTFGVVKVLLAMMIPSINVVGLFGCGTSMPRFSSSLLPKLFRGCLSWRSGEDKRCPCSPEPNRVIGRSV